MSGHTAGKVVIERSAEESLVSSPMTFSTTGLALGGLQSTFTFGFARGFAGSSAPG
eukprot:CAMPEP_0204329842 /NCGR_PEP_ID=MMETSP0469-20131031/14472_1 /ASSEMBLY_ACC=CAM_ASM_000384 /TAXON_ID=2969 /ORGANISM="Oxyrrhis marina" /LENGTH=55 /DNA_ID=CAMNT_0051312525 /DNA_START=1 /DNA_END=168 /DNA_ORIENTATION=+